ncbi:hypothetical protein [uncultured Treponema sp.]|uniref:hypothetical protein n=1 Tax=uncultured Treponema sp. TaxID=162155 RepID=UPI0025E365A4|nr:hypothetical protein [uncultured Treponema sp.]
MKKFFIAFISLCLIISFAPANLHADTAANFDDIDFPQWARDLRRTEIITFGSLPFVTLWTIVGYSMYEYGEFRNPLDKSTDSFTEDDQWKIIKISAASCLALGLTDLTINLITRSRKESRLRKLREMQAFTITPESQIKHSDLPPLREDETDEQAEERFRREMKIDSKPASEIFINGVDSVIF